MKIFSGIRQPGNVIRVLTMLLVLVALVPATATGCSSAPPPPAPVASTITVSPGSVALGDAVSLSINIRNPGDQDIADYTVNLTVNSTVAGTQHVKLPAGETVTVTFGYIAAEAGAHTANINGQTGEFTVLRPASITAGPLTIQPKSVVVGGEFNVTADLTNDGDIAGTYTAVFKLDGDQISSKDYSVGPGETLTVSADTSLDLNGSHIIEFCGQTGSVKGLRPATFKVSGMTVDPVSIYVGEEATAEATIINEGDVSGTVSVVLKSNGVGGESQEVTLDPGESQAVRFTVTPESTGAVRLGIMDASTTLTVSTLETYTNSTYYYSVDYPSGYSSSVTDPGTISFVKSQNTGLYVLTDHLSSSLSPKDYFDGIVSDKQDQFDDYTYSSLTEIKQGGAVIGYSYDYANTVSGTLWQGVGRVYKAGNLGFYVVFTAPAASWQDYRGLGLLCLASFQLPEFFTGTLNDTATGISVTLPDNWTALATGDGTQPFLLLTDTKLVAGYIVTEAVPQDMTAVTYLDEVEAQFSQAGLNIDSREDFAYDDGSSGQLLRASISAGGQSGSFWVADVISSGKAYSIVISADTAEFQTRSDGVLQMMHSLSISVPGVAGVDRSTTLFEMAGDEPTLDPALYEGAPDTVIGTLYSGLVRIDTNFDVVPDLAESWTLSQDGLTYTFHLRHDVTFHDGKPFTAADVVYSWERACDPATGSQKADLFLTDIVGARDMLDGQADTISGLTIVDDYTLKVTIDAPKTYFLFKLAEPVAYIVDEATVATGANWDEHPNGTGPFKLKEWVKDSVIVVERYDGFYEGPVPLKNVVFKLFAGDPLQLYESDSVDIAPVPLYDQQTVLDTTNPLNAELVTGTTASVSYISYNVNAPPFDDPKIREAFALALDVNKLITVSEQGQTVRAAGYLPDGIPGFDPSLQPLPYDVSQALQLIGESSYGSVSNLPPITFTTIYGLTPAQNAVIDMWQQNLGISVTVETLTDIESYLAAIRNGDYQVALGGWAADYPDPQNFLDVLFRTGSTDNHFGYSNPAVDAALDAAAAEPDQATRIQMYRDIEQQILADLPAAPLWRNDTQYYLIKPRVQGLILTSLGINEWRDVSVTP